MTKLTAEIKAFIDAEIKSNRLLNYPKLSQIIGRKFGVTISKSALSKRAKALKVQFRRGRKRIRPLEKRPVQGVYLDCAGAFFLKGAEREMGLLAAMEKLLATSSDSTQAKKTLRLAQQLNALLLYGPIFGLHRPEDWADYHQKGLLFLTEQEALPSPQALRQYGKFLQENKLLPLVVKEVIRACAEAILIRLDLPGQTFYLDAQGRTVWPTAEIPRYFSATINKTMSYVKNIFQMPNPQRPLILQVCPGYTFLPKEMFALIRCFTQPQKWPIGCILIADKAGQSLARWERLEPAPKYYFVAPLSPWQYARLEGTKIVKDFQEFRLSQEKEALAIAEAQVNLYDSQHNENIKVRAALLRRKEERLALITNISAQEERYIRRIAELYFCRWPQAKVPTYYDLLEEAQQEILARMPSQAYPTPFPVIGYSQKPEQGFRLFLEHLNFFAANRFFPAEYANYDLNLMQQIFYQQSGYLKIKQDVWEALLCPFAQEKLQKDAQEASQRFNQSDIEIAEGKRLRIFLQGK